MQGTIAYGCGCKYPTNGPSYHSDSNCATCHIIAWSSAETKDDTAAAYIMRDLRTGISDCDAWQTLRDAEDYLWARIESARKPVEDMLA